MCTHEFILLLYICYDNYSSAGAYNSITVFSYYSYIYSSSLWHRHSYGFDNVDEDERAVMVADRRKLIVEHSATHPVIIGEWSDYYNTGSADSQFTAAPKRFFDNQLVSYEAAYGKHNIHYTALQ